MPTSNIYQLTLHERYKALFGAWIMRVPGGWIYDCWDEKKKKFKRGLFIPFNTDLMKGDECQNR